MNALKGKAVLLTTSLAFWGYALPTVAQQQNLNDPSATVTPQSTLTYCDLVPPNGYFWVGVVPKASCGSVGHAMIVYVLESYFDKPVGYSLATCSPNLVPAGWYITNEISNHNCSADALSTKQWVITRYE